MTRPGQKPRRALIRFWKDLGRDYHFAGTSLEVKTATPSNVTLVSTNLKASLTFTQSWSTSNALRTQIELENQISKGLKLETTTIFNPEGNTKSVVLGAAYKQPGLHSRAVLEVSKVPLTPATKGPTFIADAVFGRDGFLFGAETSYNVTEGRVDKYSTLPRSVFRRTNTPSFSTASPTSLPSLRATTT
ncbi:eukaryotic porin-domain-containing protein, partial [Lactifluus subvellereus]